jgi:hypothetical protein
MRDGSTLEPVTTTDALLTPPQVGRALGLETYEVLVLMDSGRLPRVKGGDGLIYVPAEAVTAYAESRD